MKNKEVLIISPGYYPVTGGRGGAIEALLELYLKHNQADKITVYSAATKKLGKDEQSAQNIEFRPIRIDSLRYRIRNKIHRFTKRFLKNTYRRPYFYYAVKDLNRRHEHNRYDIIIFENSVDEILYFDKKFKTNAPKVLHLHNDLLSVETKRSHEILSALDKVWGNSSFIANRVQEIDPNRRNTKVLYNTTPLYDYRKNKAPRKDDLFRVLYTGRIMSEKGILELVEAFDQFNKKYSDVRLDIIGGARNVQQTDDYYDKIKNLVSKNPHIQMYGNIKKDELAKFYAAADVQVVPSKWNEAFGLTALEGLIFGTPVIFSSRGGLPEIFTDHDLMLPGSSADAILEKLEQVYHDRKSTQTYMRSYPQDAQKFTPEAYCKTFDKYLTEDSRNV